MTLGDYAFLGPALCGGLVVAVAAGPLGCFVLWRRLAYLGDTLAHGALFGAGLAAAVAAPPLVGVGGAGLGLALLLGRAERQRAVATETVLAILAQAGLAFGLIVAAAQGPGALNRWLLGDPLGLDWPGVAVLALGAALVLAALARLWQRLLAATVQPDLAAVEGHRVGRLRLLLAGLLALAVALAFQAVGALLVTALLVVPAATARRLVRGPEAMALGAALVGGLSVVFGLAASVSFDWPAGPAIVAAALVQFAAAQLVPQR